MLWRVLGEDGNPLAEGLVQGAGSNGVIQDFGHDVTLPTSVSARGTTSSSRSSGTTPPRNTRPAPT